MLQAEDKKKRAREKGKKTIHGAATSTSAGVNEEEMGQ